MLRRSLLALIAVTAALPVTGVFAQGESPRKLTPEEIDLINAISAHNSASTWLANGPPNTQVRSSTRSDDSTLNLRCFTPSIVE